MNSKLLAMDSCSILHLLIGPDSLWYPEIKPIYDDALLGRVTILVSEISIAECHRLEPENGKPIDKKKADEIIGGFFSSTFIMRRAVTSRESTLAAELIKTHKLGTCDALIAATAAIANAEILYTSDGCKNRRKPGKLLTVQKVECTSGATMLVKAPNALQYGGFMLPIYSQEKKE